MHFSCWSIVPPPTPHPQLKLWVPNLSVTWSPHPPHHTTIYRKCNLNIWVIFLKCGPKRVLLYWSRNKQTKNMKLFKVLLYFCCNVFGEVREMPQCVNASLLLVLQILFGRNLDIFMAVICGMAKGRLADHKYFFESVHDWIKTDFIRNKC